MMIRALRLCQLSVQDKQTGLLCDAPLADDSL